jgi:tRNA dimethylallyltransferase
MTLPDDTPLALLLLGPTASGKSALALELADRFAVEIVSVDSAQVYRGLDIGSAKPTPALQARYPHHLIDLRDPADPYSAAAFRDDALAVMAQIRARGNTPLLVGGTMLYFQLLCRGITTLPPARPALRARLLDEAEADGWPRLHQRLWQVDPVAAEQIPLGNRQRLIRALEVFIDTGIPLSQHHAEQQAAPLPQRWVTLGIQPQNRQLLSGPIAQRFRQMLDMGFVEEVQRLFERGDLHPDLPAIRAVGYRQVWSHLAGQSSHAEMVERSLIATGQLAKRQLTWMRGWPGLRPLPLERAEQLALALKIVTPLPISRR